MTRRRTTTHSRTSGDCHARDRIDLTERKAEFDIFLLELIPKKVRDGLDDLVHIHFIIGIDFPSLPRVTHQLLNDDLAALRPLFD